jgi:hypothetical protein
MKTTLKYILMTATLMTFVTVVPSAKADPTVMCSVRANYQGSVDVHGNPVAPADLKSPSTPSPYALQSVRIPLTVDLAQRMNGVLPDGMKLEPEVGTVEIRNDGHVIINGKDMTGPADALCASVAKQRESAMKTQDAPKKKKVRAKAKRAADVPADVNEPIAAQPVEPVVPSEPVVAEPVAPVAPDVQAQPEESVQDSAPQQVLGAPSEPPVMQEPTPAPESAVVPPPNEMPSQDQPEEGMLPRPPSEEPPAEVPSANDTLPTPPQGGDGMLSGGAR